MLLQNIVGEESLSAGVWYVSIDFQLFALATLLFAAMRAAAAPLQRWWPWAATAAQVVVVAGVVASLYGFNRDADWDVWALYFFGAYGLGMMAFWAVQAEKRSTALNWCLLMAALVLSALELQWRDRIALAGVTALLLVVAMRWQGSRQWQGIALLRWLGQISYSVFLIHFSVCLLVNAVETYFWPDSMLAAMLGMVLAFALSVAAGYLLYRKVERHVPSWHEALRWQAGLIGAGLLTTMLAALR